MAASQLIKVRQFEFGIKLEDMIETGKNPSLFILQAQKLTISEDGQTNLKIQDFEPNGTQVKITVNGKYYYNNVSFDVNTDGEIIWKDEYQLKTTDTVFVEYMTSDDGTDETYDGLYVMVDGEPVIVDIDGQQLPILVEYNASENKNRYYVQIDDKKVYLKLTNENSYVYVNK